MWGKKENLAVAWNYVIYVGVQNSAHYICVKRAGCCRLLGMHGNLAVFPVYLKWEGVYSWGVYATQCRLFAIAAFGGLTWCFSTSGSCAQCKPQYPLCWELSYVRTSLQVQFEVP